MAAKRFELHPHGDVLFRLQYRTKEEKSDGKNVSTNTDTNTTTQPATKSLASMSLENSSNEAAKDADEKCFLVSSTHLSLASKVFSAMLQADGFKEGETLRSTGYVEISLPDDDPDSFELLMNIVHNRSWLLPRRLDLNALVALSILADKYQMEKALVFYVDTWIELLRPTRPTTFTDQLAPWLSLSCTFDLAADFKHLTRIAIVESGRTQRGLFDPPIWALDSWEGLELPFPFGLIDKIEERRQSVLGAGFAAIQTQVESLGGIKSVCTYQSPISESSFAKTPKTKPPAAAAPAPTGIFGSTPANTSIVTISPAPSIFGTNHFGNRGPGATTTPAPSSGSIFGSTTNLTTAPSSGATFGSTTTTAPSSGGLFGSATTPAPSSGGLFGSTTTPAPSSGGLFGSVARTTPTSSLFGAPIMSSAEVATANRRTGCNGMMLGTFTMSASKLELWPLPLSPYVGWTVTNLVSRVGLIQCESLCHALNAADPKSDELIARAHGFDKALVQKLAKINQNVSGLDLDTFKQGGY